jgi:hypothetical protein
MEKFDLLWNNIKYQFQVELESKVSIKKKEMDILFDSQLASKIKENTDEIKLYAQLQLEEEKKKMKTSEGQKILNLEK